jgi:solute carrier family 25 oxoglutarate transporter 11
MADAKQQPQTAVAATGVWKTIKPFVNGGASGMLATCVIQPIDMVKVPCLHAAPASPSPPPFGFLGCWCVCVCVRERDGVAGSGVGVRRSTGMVDVCYSEVAGQLRIREISALEVGSGE